MQVEAEVGVLCSNGLLRFSEETCACGYITSEAGEQLPIAVVGVVNFSVRNQKSLIATILFSGTSMFNFARTRFDVGSVRNFRK